MPIPTDPEKCEEWSRKQSESQKKRWDNPDLREKMAPTLFKAGHVSPNKGKTIPPTPKGMRNAFYWTEEEVAILQEMYLTHTRKQLMEVLPGRSANAIQMKAIQLGLRKKLACEEPIRTDFPVWSDNFIAGDGEKRCPDCGQIKPHSQFHKCKSTSDGFQYRCRDCQKKAKKMPTGTGRWEITDDIPPGYRRCSQCREIKEDSAFFTHHREKSGRCKDCSQKQYKKGSLQNLYGLTAEEYNRMLEEQDGVCACCGKPESITLNGKIKALSVDHCHVTDAIRGLLCSRCNVALGLLAEDPDRIKALLQYVEERCLW